MARRSQSLWKLSATLVVLAIVASPTTALATPPTWPADPAWTVVTVGGQPMTDPEGDVPGSRDLVGSAAFPLFFVASDATHIFFRLRLDSEPRKNATDFNSFGWGCVMSTDGDPTDYEFSTIIDGVASNPDDTLSFYKNSTTASPNDPNDPPDLPPVFVETTPLTPSGHARVIQLPANFGGDADFFLDWAIEKNAVLMAGFDPTQPTAYYCSSSNNGTTVGADCTGGSGQSSCPLSTHISDPVGCGSSSCGICGDGTVGGTEGCDDGNLTPGDGCNDVCKIELNFPCFGTSSRCASQFCDPADNTCRCDQSSDCPVGGICNTVPNPNQCVGAGCGNGLVEIGEGCDDGNTTPGDGCNGVCLVELTFPCLTNPQCASQFCDPAGNTCRCDQTSDCPAGQSCNTTPNPNQCVPFGCGNGVLEAGEGCDDGNSAPGDGCNAGCLIELNFACTSSGACQSGFCDPANDTCRCDQTSDCPGGQVCNTTPDPNTCVVAGCGNGVLEAGEGCDDGNTSAGDGCNASCLIELTFPCMASGTCASGFCDPAGNTCRCDQDGDCPSGQKCNTAPNPNVCVAPGCGNGVLDAGEGCDDSNTAAGDGCGATCLVELNFGCAGSAQCESGFCDPAGNTCRCDQTSDCPGGLLCNTTPNPNQCVAPGCGNGVLEPGEGCDDGNLGGGDGCTASCLIELTFPCTASGACQSGFCDPTGNTCECDDSADCSIGQVCNVALDPNGCVAAGCGNNVVEPGEGCDDGNTMAGDGCNASCLIELNFGCFTSPSCASGFCDSADLTCRCDQSTDCPGAQLCNTTPNPNECVNPGCGNGLLEVGEGCDDGDLSSGDGCSASCLIELTFPCMASATCESGFCDPTGNTCRCDQTSDCLVGDVCDTAPNPNQCVPAGCGNGVLEAGEGCDDTNTTPGDGCDSSCLIELTFGCMTSPACASAFCDPADGTCRCDESADCPMGQLCNTTPSPNQCVNPGCGNGLLEVGEGCDDGNTMAGDGCGTGCLIELTFGCTLSASCESAFCDPADLTCRCDQSIDCQAGFVCNTAPDPNICTPIGCGNGVLEVNEGCDDTNTTPGDGCDGSCLIELTFGCGADVQCASTFCDPANSTCACDADVDCPTGDVCKTTTDPNTCVAAGCGNGVLEAGEGCDDGGTMSGDGCGPQCLIELTFPCMASDGCESAFCDPANSTCACDTDGDCLVTEQCATAPDPNQCVPIGCGNGTLSAGEACDDGNNMPGDGCGPSCLVELTFPCTTSTECESMSCDPVDLTCACDADADCPMGQVCDTKPEPNACVDAGCGNGVLEIGEGCDDANKTPGDGCNAACLVELTFPCDTSPDCESGACDQNAKVCVECNTDDQCPDPEVCDPTSHTCVECVKDTDCPMGDTCVMNVCVKPGCKMDTDCPSGVCDVPTGTCFECNSDADCGGRRCLLSSRTCEECIEDTDCPNGSCEPTTHTCVDDAGQAYAEGNGIFGCACSTPGGPSSSEWATYALLVGLVTAAGARRRKRA